MKIAIPVDDNSKDTSVCVSFGRTPFFMFYDTDTKESVFFENSAADSPGGAGIKAAQIIADQRAGILLTPRCGENAVEVLKAAGIKNYKTKEGSAADNIKAYMDGQLPLLTESHPGFHGHGGA